VRLLAKNHKIKNAGCIVNIRKCKPAYTPRHGGRNQILRRENPVIKAEMRMTVDVQCILPKILEFKIAVIFGKSQKYWFF
jgi:hypothetical protein